MTRCSWPAFASILLALLLHGSNSTAATHPETSVDKRFANPAESSHAPDFQRHVIPLISRQGCNGRACHGSFQGRGGMALSLFGYDFAADMRALTGASQSESGDRINKDNPEESLILLKATDTIGHEGGKHFGLDSWQYNLIKSWIANGAPREAANQELVRLEVTPKQIQWNALDESEPIRITAEWSDGTREDVSCLTRFRINDDSVVAIDANGEARSVGYGDTHLIALYDNGVAAIPVVVHDPSRPTAPWPASDSISTIDQHINRQLKFLGFVPSLLCDDSEFIRRVSIDLTGTLPSPDEVRLFLADTNPNKRSEKIDELLQRPAMAAWWANKLCDYTGCNPDQQSELGQDFAEQWYMWIYQQLRENRPYDEIVEGILLAQSREGQQEYSEYATRMSSYFRAEALNEFPERTTMPHYWSRRTLDKPSEKALAVAHSFLGIRLQCAECHKHPWDRWTQDDFQQFSRFFEDIQYGVAPDAVEDYRKLAGQIGMRVRNETRGEPIRAEQLAHAKNGKTIPWREVFVKTGESPKQVSLLGQQFVKLTPGEDPRAPIMDWLRQPDNPWFARAIVNRIWASCFHVGIIDPPDDLNAANPPSNPELLAWLSSEFVKHDYDIRWLLAEITKSDAWQRSIQPNATNVHDTKHFSRAVPRRLPAEVVYDAMKQVLSATSEQDSVRQDLSRRAVGHLSMRMAGTYAMHVFGKPERAVTCDCERINEPSLLQSVFLQNDPLILMLLDDSGWLAEIRSQESPSLSTQRRWIEEAYVRAFSRLPRREEVDRVLEHVGAADSVATGMEDFLWSLFNTKEFLLNH